MGVMSMKYAVSARVGVLHAAIVSALSGAFMSPAVAQDEDEDGVGVETVIVTEIGRAHV